MRRISQDEKEERSRWMDRLFHSRSSVMWTKQTEITVREINKRDETPARPGGEEKGRTTNQNMRNGHQEI